MTSSDSPMVREFPIWPFLRQSMVKGAWCAVLALCLLGLAIFCAFADDLGSSRWVFAIGLTLLGIYSAYWSAVVLRSGAQGLSTRFVVDAGRVRLFRGEHELGSMRLDEVHSIEWSQAPFEWFDHSQLELKDKEGSTNLALPIPMLFLPNGNSWPQPDQVSAGQFRAWKAFLAELRDRVEGREEIGPDHEISLLRERIHNFSNGFRIALMAFTSLGLCYLGLRESGAVHVSKTVDRAFTVAIMMSQFFALATNFVSNRSEAWTSNRVTQWTQDKSKPGPDLGLMAYAEKNVILSSVRHRLKILVPGRTLLLIWALLNLACGIFAWVRTGSWIALSAFSLVSVLLFLAYRSAGNVARSANALVQNLDDLLEFREGGSLVVTRPNGETLELTTTDRPFLKRKNHLGTYTDGSTEYVVGQAYMDPVEATS